MAKKRTTTSMAGKITIWILFSIMALFVAYTVACLIGGAVSPNMNFGDCFTTFFGVANQTAAAEPAAEAAETAANIALGL